MLCEQLQWPNMTQAVNGQTKKKHTKNEVFAASGVCAYMTRRIRALTESLSTYFNFNTDGCEMQSSSIPANTNLLTFGLDNNFTNNLDSANQVDEPQSKKA